MSEHGERETGRRRSSVGAYLAGTGASGSLIASALIAFGSVTAFVAFDELPGGPAADGEITIPAGGAFTVGSESGAEPIADGPIILAVAGPGEAGGPAATGAVDDETGSGSGDPGLPIPVDPPVDPTVPIDPIDPIVPTDNDPGPFPTDDNGGTPGQSIGEAVDNVVEDATGNDSAVGETLSPVTDVVDDLVQSLTGENLMSNVEGLLSPDEDAGEIKLPLGAGGITLDLP